MDDYRSKRCGRVATRDPVLVLRLTVDILREVCRDPGLIVDKTTRLDTIETLDSLKLMETVALLEERLGVEVETGGLEQLVAIEHVVALLMRAAPVG